MAGFIQNIIWNSVEGFVDAGKRSAGEYAGNALIKAGDLVENAGRSVGNGIERKATSYGSSLSGQVQQPAAAKALPSTARKPVIKRSNSLPASSKPAGVKSLPPTSKTPLGAKKYPGGNQVNGAVKRVTNSAVGGGPKSAVRGGITNGGVVGGLQKTIGGGANTTPPLRSASLPRPYPTSTSSPFPSAKKTPVRPNQPKPFKAPASTPQQQKKLPVQKAAAATPYPGTNTLPGQASRTPVVKKRYASVGGVVPRLGPQVKPGEKMNHIAV